MGLDNGIVLKTKYEITEKPSWVKFVGNPTKHDDGFLEYDICYWRKCWNIRDAIFTILEDDDRREESFDLSLKQITAIRDRMYKFLTEGENWEESEESIWTFEEIIPILAQDIVNLGWLKSYLTTHPQAVAYFYDSY